MVGEHIIQTFRVVNTFRVVVVVVVFGSHKCTSLTNLDKRFVIIYLNAKQLNYIDYHDAIVSYTIEVITTLFTKPQC